MTETNRHIEKTVPSEKAETPRGRNKSVWVSLVLALLSWVALMAVPGDYSGYIALGLGVAAVAAGIHGALRSERTLRRLAITSVIAAGVLVVVLASFIIVIKIGLAGS